MSASLPPLVQQMLKPEFYPHPVTQAIELIQTHVSFVLLTGEFVYKLKKPVDFGFLDYSTLEKRRHFCREELRMNRRGAPGIYLDVLPIVQKGDRFVLGDASGDDDDIVEYALKMKQFPPNCLFVDLLDRGELTERLMEQLGRIVADYHANAPVNEEILEFGTVEQIREAIDDNYRYTENYIGRVQTQQQFDETKAYTDRTFDRHRDWFESRVRQRKIRECHGDLHLRNIALDGDRILLFDCIEFNKPFRFVDVMYDVAFTVMDCEARGRRDLGNAFLNTYIERTGDWDGLRVLPLYLSRQAYVRAKVTSFLLDDEAVSEEEKAKAAKTASEYYRLAWEYTRSHSGKMFVMSGLSGSGKSTTARQLARRLGAIQVRSDAVRKHLAGIPLDERGSDEIYTFEMSRRTYDRLAELGAMLAKLGWTVILDAKYDRREWRKMACDRAEAASIPVQILHCTAPMSVLRDRLDRRTGDIADATADLLASQQAKAEGFTEDELSRVVEIDTTQNLEMQLTSVG
ncbi:bifunctional aminoglycoside phosphotransferase/ATP-binding protein [Baaleninema simplex]|uniref:bifunctional aminoglycoside phosphotransferase/ATP-binding protein n=1 Tax=Baaleninema simplex TaxID=2862350 RepID=UPI000345F517|nr:AAA family ATPase [Baaleninema simplex]